jgi:hypothetical protein
MREPLRLIWLGGRSAEHSGQGRLDPGITPVMVSRRIQGC